MNRITLSDEEWLRILANLKKLTGIYVGQPDTCRQFISACLWILRSGSQWRVLPPTHGKWNSIIFKRFSRWCANGAWESLFGHFSEMSDLQDVSMDGSVIRAHACAAGGRQTAPPIMRRWGVPKAVLAVRSMPSVMAWACQLSTY